VVICPQCGQENPEGFRYCGACGAEIGGEAKREVRKTVTVLFCDLADYTAAGERVDPEALRRLQARYFEDARAALERHGGTVEKFIGDAVMAVFGIPVLHEDDALRALRAAVEVRGAVESLGFRPRIGLNTGEVVAGAGDALVTGDAVNVAARLEQAAQPGEILLGEATRALARYAIDAEPVESVDAKGKTEPVAAFRLLGVSEGDEAITRRLEAPLVGRRSELETARSVFSAAVAERRCRLLTVLGQPGIGKSRLARELAQALGDQAEVLSGRCLSYGEGITYWPFVEIFREAGAENELAAVLSAGAPEDIFWSMRKALEQRARTRPTVLVVEDIHWAEKTLLDLVEHLAEWTRDAPLLLMCLARPELLDERPAWGGAQLRLEQLSATETEELISELLTGLRLDEEAHVRIRETSEGNPLYVEQLVAMLAEGGDPERIPPTIQALLAARLDGLPDDQRELLERAAVIGLEFEWDALAELDPERRRPPGAQLTALVRKELIRPHEAIEDTFRFRHMLIRDAAYDRIPKAQRADLHERFADWLDGRGEEFEEIVGYHLEQAHGWLLELGPQSARSDSLAARAAELLAASGQRASARGDMAATTSLLRRATALLSVDDPRRVRLLPMLGRALLDRGEWDEARDVLSEAVHTGGAIGERAAVADASVGLAFHRLHTHRHASHADVRSDLFAAIEVFEELDDAAALARALTLAGNLRFWSGDAAGAIEDLERAARHAHEAGDIAQEADSLRAKMVAALYGPTQVETAARVVVDVRARARGSRKAEVAALYVSAELHAMQGRFHVARNQIADARALAEELALEVLLSAAIGRIAGEIELLAGAPAAAEHVLLPACDALERMGDWGHFASVVPILVDALYQQGRAAGAARWIELAFPATSSWTTSMRRSACGAPRQSSSWRAAT
jgi:class 3 adenylate cyclase